MDLTECAWCGTEIEDAGIDHKGLIFCSGACIRDWDEDVLTADDIDLGLPDDEGFDAEPDDGLPLPADDS